MALQIARAAKVDCLFVSFSEHFSELFGGPGWSGRKKAHKHKLFVLVNVQMALGQTAGCPRANRAKQFRRSPRNTGNKNFSLLLTGGLSQACPDFQKVYVSHDSRESSEIRVIRANRPDAL